MSPKNRSDAIKDGARQAAAQLKPAAERAKPLAKSTGEAARRGILRTRAWAAPQVERSGQVLQDTVAPKVSEVLSSAARRIDPAQPRLRRWQKPVGLATLTAAGGAIAAFFRIRRKQSDQAMNDAGQVKASPNGQATTGMGATEVDSQAKS
ncbi:MAG: hypothetical protein ACTHJW_22555 [Streptosporangiaceae bacterium]